MPPNRETTHRLEATVLTRRISTFQFLSSSKTTSSSADDLQMTSVRANLEGTFFSVCRATMKIASEAKVVAEVHAVAGHCNLELVETEVEFAERQLVLDHLIDVTVYNWIRFKVKVEVDRHRRLGDAATQVGASNRLGVEQVQTRHLALRLRSLGQV